MDWRDLMIAVAEKVPASVLEKAITGVQHLLETAFTSVLYLLGPVFAGISWSPRSLARCMLWRHPHLHRSGS